METWNKLHMVASLYQTFYRKIISYDTTYKILTHTHTYIHICCASVGLDNKLLQTSFSLKYLQIHKNLNTQHQVVPPTSPHCWCYRWWKIMNCKDAVANTWHNVNIKLYKNSSSGSKHTGGTNDAINLIFSFYNKSAMKAYSKNVFYFPQFLPLCVINRTHLWAEFTFGHWLSYIHEASTTTTPIQRISCVFSTNILTRFFETCNTISVFILHKIPCIFSS
jgi:hypothetical protein